MKSWHANGESSSSPSNLSAFAPPFTVSPFPPGSDSSPYMNSSDPSLGLPVNSSLNSWLSPNPSVSGPDWLTHPAVRELDAVNYSSEIQFPGSYPHGHLVDDSRTNIGEVRPYYPQYYFPRADSDKPVAFSDQSSSDGLPSSQSGKMIGSVYLDTTSMLSNLNSPPHVSGTFSETTKREWHEPSQFEGSFWYALKSGADASGYVNQGAHSFEGFGAAAEAPDNMNVLNRGKNYMSTCFEQEDMKSFPEKNPDLTTAAYPATATSESISLQPEAHSSAPPLDLCLEARVSGEMVYSDMVGIHPRHNISGTSHGDSIVDSIPELSIGPPTSSPIFEGFLRKHGDGRASASEYFGGSIFSSSREPIPVESSERNLLFDATQLRFDPGKNDTDFGKFCPIMSDCHPNAKAVSSDVSKSKRLSSGMNVHGINIARESNHAFSSFENVLEALNQYNHAVDSPCWKGIPSTCFGSSKACEVVVPNHVEFKDFNSLNPQTSQASVENDGCSLNFFSQRLSEATVKDINRISGRNSSLPLEQHGVLNPSAIGERFGDVEEFGSSHLRPSYFFGAQVSGDVNGPCKRNVNFDELTGDVSFKLSQVKQNSCGQISKENQPVELEGPDTGRKIGEAINTGLSDVSYQCVEHVLNSPTSPIDSSANKSAFCGQELTQKVDIPILLKAMQNLSELLLLYSSTGTCDLKEQDYVILTDVVNNLDACCLKDVELVSGKKEPNLSTQGTSVLSNEPPKHRKSEELEEPFARSAIADDQKQPPGLSNAEKRMQTILPDMPGENSSNPGSICSRSDTTKDDTLSQKGKMMEGSQHSDYEGQPDVLCNCKKHCPLPGLPDDGMSDTSAGSGLPDFLINDEMTQAIKRILLENFHDEEGVEPQTLLFKNLWLEAEAALCSMNYKARYNRVRSQMEKSKSQKRKETSKSAMGILSNSGVCTNLSTEYKLRPADTHPKDLDIPILSFCPAGTTANVDDVMARVDILKKRDRDRKCINAEEVEALPNPDGSDDLDKAGKLTAETCEATPCSSESFLNVSSSTQAGVESSALGRICPPKLPGHSSSFIGDATSPNAHLESITSQNFPIEDSNPKTDIESSVLERLTILKQRDDYISSSKMDDMSPRPPPVALTQVASESSPAVGGWSIHQPDSRESPFLKTLFALKSQMDDFNSMEMDGKPPAVVHLGSLVSQDLPVGSSASELHQMDTSVLARFSILKQLDDIASSLGGWDCAHPNAVNLESAVKQDYFPVASDETGAWSFSGSSCSALLSQNSNCSVDMLRVKELDPNFSDNKLLQSHWTNTSENSTLAGCDDSVPSEWEHVQKEDVNGQNPRLW